MTNSIVTQSAMTNAEQAVGISGFLGSHCGFSGLLKHRWDDFHVHEVGQDDRVLHLTELISRSEVVDKMKSKRHLDSGEGTIGRDFHFDEDARQELLEVGFFSPRDITVVEEFIDNLAVVADPPAIKSGASSEQIEESTMEGTGAEGVGIEGSGDTDDLEVVRPQLVRENVSVRTPPYCLILGDFERCLKSLIEENKQKQLPPPTETQAWKNLRRSIHLCTRQALPFICSDTLTLNELCSLIGSFPDLLTQFHIPTVAPYIENNPAIQTRLSEFKAQASATLDQYRHLLTPDSTNNPIDQFSRVIRLCPKPPCLFLMFKHLRRDPKSHQLPPLPGVTGCNAVPLGSNDPTPDLQTQQDNVLHDNPHHHNAQPARTHRCDCHKRMRRVNRSKRSNDIGPNGICNVCNGLAREPRLASHFDRWPRDRPPYLYFHLWKSNRDTADAINMIATCLGTNPRIFTFAGTKDKRAVTVQAVTVLKVTIQQMHKALLHPRWDRSIRISDLRYQSERVSLGSHHGNHFRICLRNVVEPNAEELVKEACQSLRDKGFINFFGLQRFGTRTIRTHQIGAAILRGDYEIAVRLILGDVNALGSNEKIDGGAEDPQVEMKGEEVKVEVMEKEEVKENSIEGENKEDEKKRPYEMDSADTNSKRRKIEKTSQSPCALYLMTGNAKTNLRDLPHHCYVERQILKSLSEDGSNYLRALQHLPKNTMTLHVHATQSVVWNAVVAHRLQKFGKKPVLGDFVLKNEVQHKPEEIETPAEEEQINDDACIHDVPEESDFVPANRFEVRVLDTAEDVENASLFDVVLPVPGDGVVYPDYLLPIYEQTCRESVGLNLADIKSNSQIGEYAGSYRHICVRPQDVRYHFLHSVKNGTEKLLASDVDRILNHPVVQRDCIADPTFAPIVTICNTAKPSEPEAEDALTNTAAVLLSCTLPKSSYLTMACRELFMGKECPRPTV